MVSVGLGDTRKEWGSDPQPLTSCGGSTEARPLPAWENSRRHILFAGTYQWGTLCSLHLAPDTRGASVWGASTPFSKDDLDLCRCGGTEHPTFSFSSTLPLPHPGNQASPNPKEQGALPGWGAHW